MTTSPGATRAPDGALPGPGRGPGGSAALFAGRQQPLHRPGPTLPGGPPGARQCGTGRRCSTTRAGRWSSWPRKSDWAIGSGAKGYSYLTERDGYLLQTPISWFTQKRRWDLSPGFGPSVLAGRVVSASCLFCHANRVREDPGPPRPLHAAGVRGARDRLRALPRAGRAARPRRRRMAPSSTRSVCLPLCATRSASSATWKARRASSGPAGACSITAPACPCPTSGRCWSRRTEGDDAKAVNHVEQMHQSKCFQRPVGSLQLGCITCHDPHVLGRPRGARCALPRRRA